MSDTHFPSRAALAVTLRFSRRRLLQVGGLGLMGISLPRPL